MVLGQATVLELNQSIVRRSCLRDLFDIIAGILPPATTGRVSGNGLAGLTIQE
jgi:hypothetical protein